MPDRHGKISHEEYIDQIKDHARRRILEIAQLVLGNQIGVLVASSELAGLLRDVEAEIDPDDLNMFVGIASECDDLPIGSVRQYWNKKALAEKDLQITRYEARCKEGVIGACHRLVAKFQT